MTSEGVPNLENLPALRANLQPEGELARTNQANELSFRAEHLLNQTGRETTINGVPAQVTSYSVEVALGEETFFARLGRYSSGNARQDEDNLQTIVFCTTRGIADIRTPNFNTLRFQSNITGTAELMTQEVTPQGGVSPIINNPEHLELAEKIIDGIAAQHAKAQMIETYQKAQQRQQRARQAGAAAASVVCLYGHVAFGHIDAKIGPVPMPSVIELLVDAANQPDHKAQGFPKPTDALPIAIGSDTTSIPVLPKYDTEGVPDASVYDPLSTGYQGEESRRGLYKSDFNTSDTTAKDSTVNGSFYRATDSAEFDTNGCYTVRGDYADGRTEIFTQTPNLSRLVRLRVADLHNLQVCKLRDAPQDASGSFFLYQNKK